MENKDINTDPEVQHDYLSWQKGNRRGKIMGGIVVVAFGVLFLLREANVQIADWIFSWQMILIAVGAITLVRHKFRKLFGYVLITVGTLFLFKEWYPNMVNLKFIWPILIILFGLVIIFKPHKPERFRKKDWERWRKHRQHHHRHHFGAFEDLEAISKDDFIDSVSFFSGIKKNVVSKQFRGADVVTICGGSELNLLQADFEDKSVVDITCFFGGMTLTIPSNWQVKSELTSIFGGIEDKTVKNPANPDPEIGDKVLILKGTCFFGGIEINNYG